VVLFLFWCTAIIGKYKSRFGGAKSRFGCPEFPVCPVMGIRGQRLGLARYFLHQMVVFGARLTKFPVLRVNSSQLFSSLGSMGDAKVADFLEQWIDLGAIDGGF